MDASIVALRVIGGDILIVRLYSLIFVKTTPAVFFVPYYDYSKIFHIFMTNYCE